MLNHDDDDGVTVVVNERGKGTLPEKVFKVPSNIGTKTTHQKYQCNTTKIRSWP